MGSTNSRSSGGRSGSEGTTMRAAVYRRFGDADVVEVDEVPVPVLRDDEVLIRVHAGTVSAGDYRARTRDVPRGVLLPAALTVGFFRPRRPILGMDVAGVVAAVGPDVTRFRVGDEVIAMLGAAYGGHAEFAAIREGGAIAAKPRNLSFEEAVTLVFGGITARAFLAQSPLAPGARVLVNGASGAVGTAAVQLAKEAGAHVTAVCSAGSSGLVASLGADRVIDYRVTDFTQEDQTYDVIVECVGNAPFERVEGLISPGGALLLVITDLLGVLRAPGRTRRSGKKIVTGPGRYRGEDLGFLVGLAEQRRFRPVIDRIYPLDDIVEAHRHVAGGHKKGNVVVRLTPAEDAAGAGEDHHTDHQTW
ncbi:NAD(P)-dependent alcohol dehydrogenase [Naasia sp. SYSU D00948]|uniref:NAD(P)-dependent alcohol dehydrogenase n=1 Tax=Naasia sp. SYSU D00948 TaxID=2817379 RepID=UPI001B306A59|nr:NAD(P)-dependent alcohol dehydrogenase [Naasia sp. SYSU D00948]